MELKQFNVYFFFVLLLGVSGVAFMIFQPFLIAILLAAIFAVIFNRPFLFFLKITRQRRRLAAFLTSLAGIAAFLFIFVGLTGLLVNEASNFFANIGEQGDVYKRYVEPFVERVNANPFLGSIGIENLLNRETVSNSLSQLTQGSLQIVQRTYQSIAHFIFLLIIMFFTLYYFLVGGKDLVGRIMYLSPLRDSHEKILVDRFISISRATVKGTLVVGIVQGMLGGIAFFIAGVPSAAVWAVLMMFLSLIPMLGTGLVWGPIGLILLLSGNIWQGVFVLAFGAGVISIVDNFLRPKLVGSKTQMHPLVVFFATLGGIGLFGFLGFIIGPVIIAFAIALWDIYSFEFKEQLNEYNK